MKKIGGARVLTGTGWTTGGIVASTSGLPLIFSLKHKFCKDKVPFMPKSQYTWRYSRKKMAIIVYL